MVLLGVVALTFAILAALFPGRDALAAFHHLRNVDSFSQVIGTVDRSWIETKYDADGFPILIPRAEYSYYVDSSLHSSTRVAPFEYPIGQAAAGRFLSDYASGKDITVYVSSDNPDSALLLIDLPTDHTIGAFVVAGIILLLSLVALIVLGIEIVRQLCARLGHRAILQSSSAINTCKQQDDREV